MSGELTLGVTSWQTIFQDTEGSTRWRTTHGLQVDVIEERWPGYIVHEDEYQVVAEPFQETRT